MVYILAEVSYWPPILAALLGAFVGGLGGQVAGHMFAHGRERRQKLREAYGDFAGLCFRFLDLRAENIRLTNEDIHNTELELSSAKLGDHQRVDRTDWKKRWAENQERVRPVLNDLETTKCKLAMLLSNEPAMRKEVRAFYERMFLLNARRHKETTNPPEGSLKDGKEHPLQAKNMAIDLRYWMDERAAEIENMDIIHRCC